MAKIKKREKQIVRSLLVVFVLFGILVPVVLADDGTASSAGTSGGSWWSRLTSALPDSFSELSSQDVGFKPRVKPHFAATSSYNSNVNLAAPRGKGHGAWQGRIAPGIKVAIPFNKLYTEIDYTYGFSTTQGPKTHSNINTHNLGALVRYDLSENTILGAGNNIQWSEVPGEAGRTFTLETATAQVKHRISPKLLGTITDTFQWFDDASKAASPPLSLNNEFKDNGIGTGLTYDVTSDLSVASSFDWNIRKFAHIEAKDYWQIKPQLSASYRLGPKTTVGGNFGWALRRFEHVLGTGNATESELVYGASVSHLIGRKLTWKIDYAKTLVDTFDTSFVFRDSPEAANLDNLDRNFRVMKSHRIGSAATYYFNEKNSLSAFGDFQFLNGDSSDNFLGTENHEKAMEIGAGYSYRLTRYVSFEILYAFGRRFSTENTAGRNEYTFHKATGGLNVSV